MSNKKIPFKIVKLENLSSFHLKESEKKQERPYIWYEITLKSNLKVALPFRSHIKHQYRFTTVTPQNHAKIGVKGLDYSKAIITNNLPNLKISNAFINKSDFKIIQSNFLKIEKEFNQYVSLYKKTYMKQQNNIPLTKREINIVSNSTLQNFHKELNLEQSQKIQHNTQTQKINSNSRPSIFQKIQEIEKSNSSSSDSKNTKKSDKER